jgi:hypothetical protein
MKSRILVCVIAAAVLAALGVAVRLPAQNAAAHRTSAKLHPCRLAGLERTNGANSAGPRPPALEASLGSRSATVQPSCFRNCTHSGYCDAVYSNGKWLTNGECVSHNLFGFCDIQPSVACPNGAPVKRLSSTSCGGLGSAEIDVARTCSF